MSIAEAVAGPVCEKTSVRLQAPAARSDTARARRTEILYIGARSGVSYHAVFGHPTIGTRACGP
jgi:hypothetical protein